MTFTPFEQQTDTPRYLAWLNTELSGIADSFRAESLVMPTQELAEIAMAIEQVARTAEQLQLIAAHAVEHQNVAVVGESDQRMSFGMSDDDSSGGGLNRTGCRDNAEYLRNTLRISKSDARRRIRVSGQVLPTVQLNGQPLAPRLEHLGAAIARSEVSSQAATLISSAMERVKPFASCKDLDDMEATLTRQAVVSDLDVLRVLIQRWESLLNPDGSEPTEEVLRARQGVFLRGKRHGLHFIEISATDEQFEDLITVMYSATNPRARAGLSAAEAEKLGGVAKTLGAGAGAGVGARVGAGTGAGAGTVAGTDGCVDAGARPSGAGMDPSNAEALFGPTGDSAAQGAGTIPEDELDRSTWAQQLLDGLVGACRIALASSNLSAAGGMRPQVLVTINYKDLMADVGRAGHAAFGGLISARSIRRIACDANVLPVVLGTQGQILDVGNPRRLFPPTIRKALTARDGGCAFPDCMMPSPWTEGHHIIPWSRGGPTTVDNGVLLCTRHHHLLHQEEWKIEVRDRTPWFVPPRYIDPAQRPRQNHYHRDHPHQQDRNPSS
ncbi:HNH endonuclease signature motif containing protein [Arthrobacter sp. Bz4]|uniref:HNH endonuclease signature motif containing protein n=1 Tax=Arthrobacter sp. Bz4 TaxID=2171979 RepID=UPI000D50DE0D|nr:HNH endonuclease signature motif containing protein [Arthrobacter sp. Bz4]PVE20106.1 HNH endonuclease [Arthrobacter sp. Bz4]